MSEREKILGRIREALQTKAPHPGHHAGMGNPSPPPGPAATARDWLPLVGSDLNDQMALFAKNAADLKADSGCWNPPAKCVILWSACAIPKNGGMSRVIPAA
jgi:hypothetical protein